MGKKVHEHRLDFIFILVVFCVFAASVLVVLTLGASVYKGMSYRSHKGYDDRTGLSYIWAKVKNGEGSGEIYTSDFQGLSILCLEENSDGVKYITKIYLYDGWIRELTSEDGLEFSPEDGMPVIEANTLSFAQQENGLIKATANGRDLYIYPRVQTDGYYSKTT